MWWLYQCRLHTRPVSSPFRVFVLSLCLLVYTGKKIVPSFLGHKSEMKVVVLHILTGQLELNTHSASNIHCEDSCRVSYTSHACKHLFSSRMWGICPPSWTHTWDQFFFHGRAWKIITPFTCPIPRSLSAFSSLSALSIVTLGVTWRIVINIPVARMLRVTWLISLA